MDSKQSERFPSPTLHRHSSTKKQIIDFIANINFILIFCFLGLGIDFSIAIVFWVLSALLGIYSARLQWQEINHYRRGEPNYERLEAAIEMMCAIIVALAILLSLISGVINFFFYSSVLHLLIIIMLVSAVGFKALYHLVQAGLLFSERHSSVREPEKIAQLNRALSSRFFFFLMLGLEALSLGIAQLTNFKELMWISVFASGCITVVGIWQIYRAKTLVVAQTTQEASDFLRERAQSDSTVSNKSAEDLRLAFPADSIPTHAMQLSQNPEATEPSDLVPLPSGFGTPPRSPVVSSRAVLQDSFAQTTPELQMAISATGATGSPLRQRKHFGSDSTAAIAAVVSEPSIKGSGPHTPPLGPKKTNTSGSPLKIIWKSAPVNPEVAASSSHSPVPTLGPPIDNPPSLRLTSPRLLPGFFSAADQLPIAAQAAAPAPAESSTVLQDIV